MATPVRRRGRSLLPEVTDWFESFPALPSLWGRPLQPGVYGIRIEDYTEDGRYLIRAELPGVDPQKDVDITVDEHVLTIRAERSEEQKDKQYREFRYGSFTRSVPLPVGAKEEEISASYDDGILTVTVPLGESEQPGRQIPVQRG